MEHWVLSVWADKPASDKETNGFPTSSPNSGWTLFHPMYENFLCTKWFVHQANAAKAFIIHQANPTGAFIVHQGNIGHTYSRMGFTHGGPCSQSLFYDSITLMRKWYFGHNSINIVVVYGLVPIWCQIIWNCDADKGQSVAYPEWRLLKPIFPVPLLLPFSKMTKTLFSYGISQSYLPGVATD